MTTVDAVKLIADLGLTGFIAALMWRYSGPLVSSVANLAAALSALQVTVEVVSTDAKTAAEAAKEAAEAARASKAAAERAAVKCDKMHSQAPRTGPNNDPTPTKD